VPIDWTAGDNPKINVDNDDADGLCLHLGTDAFVEWEDAVRGHTHFVLLSGFTICKIKTN
jgi:hypothetical protein